MKGESEGIETFLKTLGTNVKFERLGRLWQRLKQMSGNQIQEVKQIFLAQSELMKPVSPQAAQLPMIFVDNKNKEPDLGHSMTFIVTES